MTKVESEKLAIVLQNEMLQYFGANSEVSTIYNLNTVLCERLEKLFKDCSIIAPIKELPSDKFNCTPGLKITDKDKDKEKVETKILSLQSNIEVSVKGAESGDDFVLFVNGGQYVSEKFGLGKKKNCVLKEEVIGRAKILSFAK